MSLQLLTDAIWNQWIEPHATRFAGSRDRTYFGAVGDAGEVRIAALDHDTGVVESALLATKEGDDHNAPAVLIDSSGVLHAFYARHAAEGKLYYRRATSTESIDGFTAEATLTFPGTVTYAQAFQAAGGRIVVFCRAGTPTRGWMEAHSDDGGETWSTARMWVAPSSQRYMIAKQHTDGDTLSVAFGHHPSDSAFHEIYFAHVNLSTGKISTPDDGAELANLYTGAAFNPTTDGLLVYDPAVDVTTRLWDVSPNDEVVFETWDEGDLSTGLYHYVTISDVGAVGTVRDLVASGDTIDDAAGARGYFGGIFLGDDEGVVFLARENAGDWSVERWTTEDGGANWDDLRLDDGSAGKRFRPMTVRNRHPVLPCIWAEGTYTSYTSYATDLYGAQTMAGFSPDEGKTLRAQVLHQRTHVDRDADLELGLFTDADPDGSITEATVTEPTGTGYARVDLDDDLWDVTDDLATYAAQTFTAGAGGWTGEPRGYFIATKSSGGTQRIVYMEVDPNGSRDMSEEGSEYEVTPRTRML